MDSDLLVDTKFEDGENLIRQLMREHFGVEVALWVKASEEGLWQLLIASPAIDPRNLGEALRRVHEALAKVPNCSISPSEITLLSSTDPVARDAVALRDRYPSRIPKRYYSIRLGKQFSEELILYPRRFPLQVREREVLISESDDVWFTCDSEEDARAIASARVLEYEALARLKSGPQFKAELLKVADVMEKYRMIYGADSLRDRAREI